MTQRILKNPWAWVAVLLVTGVGLSVAAATRSGEPVRAEETRTNPEYSCIPVMETSSEGKPTGKISCASDEQVRTLCDAVKKR
jgi:hypothetical protein